MAWMRRGVFISKQMQEHRNPRIVEKDGQICAPFTKRQVKRELQARIPRKNKNKMKLPIARLSTSKEVAPKGFTYRQIKIKIK